MNTYDHNDFFNDWDDDDEDDMSPEEQERMRQEMREEHRRISNHPLYIKACEILHIAEGILSAMPEEERETKGSLLIESAQILAPKIAGALGSGSYTVSMQNAAIIRYHGDHIRLSEHILKDMTEVDSEYIKMLRAEMEQFRDLFRKWVAEFELLYDEEPEDEWGLFLKRE
jgi:hypothetical protein